MAYVPRFKFDLFISYAHVDNLTAAASAQGWVAQFHKNLEIQLWKRVGRTESVKIWRDERLDGNQLFDKTLADTIRQSAVFVALTSNGYLASDYCRQELHTFNQEASADPCGLVVGDRLRIFNVLLNNIPFSGWPIEFAGSSGYRFHDAKRDDDLGEPIDPGDREFQQGMRGLVDSIYKTLVALNEKSEASTNALSCATAVADGGQPTGGFTIYVADTADSLNSSRKRLINELQQQGSLRVVSNIPPPYEAGLHHQQATNTLARADLSVHLLDEWPGREIEGSPGFYYPQAQAELALTHSKSPFIWVPQKLDTGVVEDDGYKRFLATLEGGSREQRPFDFVRGSSSTVVREVLNKVEELRARPAPEEAAPEAALLDTHLKDQLHAFELSRFLLERKVQPYINPEEDDPRKNLALFTERLKQVSLLIIFFGNVAEEWVRARLAAALQIAITENCPLKACGVYLAPPNKAGASIQLGQKLFPIELMDNSQGFNAASVTRFLGRLKAAGAR